MRTIRSCFVLLFAVSFATGQSMLDNLLSPSRLPYLKSGKLIQISSNDTTGGNDDFITIPAGAAAQLAYIKGPGMITMFWTTISSSDKYFLRHIVLRMYWDGEKDPSVEVPIGDFFGTGFQYKQYITPFVGMSSGGYYCYFPMPFNVSARVEVLNETGQVIPNFYYHIDYHQLAAPLDSTVAYFHAMWHREIRTDPSHYFTLLEAEGEGQLVGINLNMQSYDGGLSFLEGDEMIYVDGEKEASIKGTGTEDYFNSGWYFNQGEFSAPYHGLILKDDSLGRIAAYRFHILDCIPFKKSIRALIEHGTQNTEIADYSSTAYWYQKEPHRPFAPMLSAGLRIPLRVQVPNGALEAESLTPQETSLTSSVEDMSAYGADWSGFKQLKVEGQKKGDGFRLHLPAKEGRYDVDVYFTKGPSFGNADIVSADIVKGSFKGYNETIVPGGKISLKNLRPLHGEIVLRFAVNGKETSSAGYAVGLDAFVLKPYRSFVPAWYVCGPFPNPQDSLHGRAGIDAVYPPEKEIDLKKKYRGVDGQDVRWRLTKCDKNGFLDLSTFRPSDLTVGYALTYVYSARSQTLPLLVGSDDGIKVLLNGALIYRFIKNRPAIADQDTVMAPLKKGWNTLLLKIENNLGGFGCFARIADPEDAILYSTSKRK
jgi:hypothetical protein